MSMHWIGLDWIGFAGVFGVSHDFEAMRIVSAASREVVCLVYIIPRSAKR
jgi:hypothetical protein